MHLLTDQLADTTDARERHRIKARAFAALTGQVGRSVTRGRFTIALTSFTLEDDLLTFSVSIKRAGVDVTPPDLNPIRVHNPPILVPDPAGDIVRTSVSFVTGEITTLRFREDLPAALMAILRDLAR